MARVGVVRGAIAAGLVAAAMALAAGSHGADPRLAVAAQGTARATPSAEHVVDIHYLRYDPDPIEIAAGESIEWVNRDALPHTVSSPEGEPLDSEKLGLGDRYRLTFSDPGKYDYICLFHAQMHGTVIVSATSATPPTG